MWTCTEELLQPVGLDTEHVILKDGQKTANLLPSSGCYDQDSVWKIIALYYLAWPVSVCPSFCPLTNRERVPLCSLEESRPEIHELGDHRALLRCQRYATAIFVLFYEKYDRRKKLFPKSVTYRNWFWCGFCNTIFPESREVNKCWSLRLNPNVHTHRLTDFEVRSRKVLV